MSNGYFCANHSNDHDFTLVFVDIHSLIFMYTTDHDFMLMFVNIHSLIFIDTATLSNVQDAKITVILSRWAIKI